MECNVFGRLFHSSGSPTGYDLSPTVFNLELEGTRDDQNCEHVEQETAMFFDWKIWGEIDRGVYESLFMA